VVIVRVRKAGVAGLEGPWRGVWGSEGSAGEEVDGSSSMASSSMLEYVEVVCNVGRYGCGEVVEVLIVE